jgi:hypothetical protein
MDEDPPGIDTPGRIVYTGPRFDEIPTLREAKMTEIAELMDQQTIKLPADVAARFRPADRFVVWADGDTLHLKRITPPRVTERVEQAPVEQPMPMEEISKLVHEVRRQRKRG